MKSILVGAVAYAPQIVPIWDTIREYANDYFKDIRLDYVLFSNYERQVQWLKEGKIDIAWNTNVAYIRSQHITSNGVEAILMRDTDIGFKSVFVTKRDTIKALEDLKGKKFGLGSLDSAQAAIMPLFYLQQTRLALKEMPLDSLHLANTDETLRIYRFNSDVGKHGDTGRSEFDVLDKIKNGELDAGAIGSSTWARIMQEGNYPEMVNFYTSSGYCHCNFTTLKSFDSSLKKSFVEMMKSQNTLKNDPKISSMMSLEGLNEWVLCDENALKGYEEIAQAMKEQHLLDIPSYE
ncbi:PhnD/SsuA/transferrin family substrate-binding protein [Helicobacter sp. MIT 21-1697]|uniref:phosphate/phosphite/phosphonate ABC transporter substrate-binding protein n=1 Tax=Helicobacter sp. MIT 21-1697 TaxID=2993733 RepID=UPI00224A93FE|nr:PhnD/SsuA/transferrin family substrate-binding protein [Helicobacter sp. MIT 21-1697]MCX2717524.1 PhnD/SsuA/transferrin family substrate-binding protein [Helicobacter sp. MIT 21-1697]